MKLRYLQGSSENFEMAKVKLFTDTDPGPRDRVQINVVDFYSAVISKKPLKFLLSIIKLHILLFLPTNPYIKELVFMLPTNPYINFNKKKKNQSIYQRIRF